jgi:Na+/glutamate symporter
MPLERFVLIVVCVLAGFVATTWLGMMVIAALNVPFAWLALIPAVIVGYVIYRVIDERVSSEEDDYYDKMDH